MNKFTQNFDFSILLQGVRIHIIIKFKLFTSFDIDLNQSNLPKTDILLLRY